MKSADFSVDFFVIMFKSQNFNNIIYNQNHKLKKTNNICFN